MWVSNMLGICYFRNLVGNTSKKYTYEQSWIVLGTRFMNNTMKDRIGSSRPITPKCERQPLEMSGDVLSNVTLEPDNHDQTTVVRAGVFQPNKQRQWMDILYV